MIDLDAIERRRLGALRSDCRLCDALDDVADLLARVRELEALLRCDNENMDNGWVIDADGWYRQCPWCGVAWTPETDYEERIHSLDCPWRTVLDEEQ